MIPTRLKPVFWIAVALTAGACATAPEPASGFLSAYEGLEERTDTVRASVRQSRDEAAAANIERIRIEPTVLVEGAAPDLTPAEQALVLGEIDRLLALAGSNKERILSATIYLADVAGFADMNRAWEAWVPANAKPARATVEAKLVAPEYRVEIQVVALA